MKPADFGPMLQDRNCENVPVPVKEDVVSASFSGATGKGKNVSVRQKLSVKLLHAVPSQTVPSPVANDSLSEKNQICVRTRI